MMSQILKWDVIKMEIRSFTLQYSKRKARTKKDNENKILTKFNNLQEKLCSSKNYKNLLNECHALKAKKTLKVRFCAVRLSGTRTDEKKF